MASRLNLGNLPNTSTNPGTVLPGSTNNANNGGIIIGGGGIGGGGNGSSPLPPSGGPLSNTRKFVLKPYKPALVLDQPQAVELWLKLQNAIGRIYSQEASQLSFEELYR